MAQFPFAHIKRATTSLLLICSSIHGDESIALRPEAKLPQLNAILESAAINTPDLIEQNFLKKESDERLRQARARYYPRVDLNASFGYRRDYRSGDAENTDNLGLTYSARLSRPIYHWGAIEARIQQARIDNDTQTLNYLVNTQGIYRKLRSDYLTILLNACSLESERLEKDLTERELERLRVDFDNGNISEIAYKTRELDLQNTILRIKRLERDQTRIVENFKNVAGWNAPLSVDSTVPDTDLNALNEWVQAQDKARSHYWTEQTPEILLVKNEIDDQREELRIISARQKPLLNFTARASQNQSNTSTQNNVDTFSVFGGLSVSWNIFDGFQTKHERIEARLKENRLQAKLDRVSIELLEQQTRMLDKIQFQADQTAVLNALYSLQERRFENSQTEAREGRLSDTQLKESELELRVLRLETMTARAELLMSLSDYQDLISPVS